MTLAVVMLAGVLASRAEAAPLVAPALRESDAAGLGPGGAHWSMLLLNGAVLLLGVSWVVLMLRRRG